MSPWLLLGGAALGAIQGQRKQDQINRMNQAQAETTRYSPWTGMKGQLQNPGGGWFDGALSGGLTGAMLGQQFGGDNTVAPKPGQLETMGAGNAAAFDAGQYNKMKALQDSRVAAQNPWMIG